MSWWKRPKLAMPLPRATGYPDDLRSDSYGTLNAVDQQLKQPAADAVNAEHPDLNYLSNGSYGVAYGTPDPNTVIKVTSDSSEYATALQLMKKPCSCIVGVKSAQEIQKSTRSLDSARYFKLVLERVLPLDEEDSSAVSNIADYVEDGQIMSLDSILAYFTKYQDKEDLAYKRAERIERIYPAYAQMISCITASGYSPHDAHGKNVGYTADGRMVMLDLGGLSAPHPEEPEPSTPWSSKDDELLNQLNNAGLGNKPFFANSWFRRLKIAARMWDGWIDERGQMIPVQYGETHSTCAVRALKERGENVSGAKSDLDYIAPYARGWIRIKSVSNISLGSVQANKQQIDALMYYLQENSMDKVMVDMPSNGIHNYISVALFKAILEGRSGAVERAKTPDFAIMQF